MNRWNLDVFEGGSKERKNKLKLKFSFQSSNLDSTKLTTVNSLYKCFVLIYIQGINLI